MKRGRKPGAGLSGRAQKARAALDAELARPPGDGGLGDPPEKYTAVDVLRWGELRKAYPHLRAADRLLAGRLIQKYRLEDQAKTLLRRIKKEGGTAQEELRALQFLGKLSDEAAKLVIVLGGAPGKRVQERPVGEDNRTEMDKALAEMGFGDA